MRLSSQDAFFWWFVGTSFVVDRTKAWRKRWLVTKEVAGQAYMWPLQNWNASGGEVTSSSDVTCYYCFDCNGCTSRVRQLIQKKSLVFCDQRACVRHDYERRWGAKKLESPQDWFREVMLLMSDENGVHQENQVFLRMDRDGRDVASSII
jgi:hypothetical protein